MCDGQVEARIDAHTRRRNRLDRRANTARRVRTRSDDFCSGRSGHERPVCRNGRRTFVSPVARGKRGRSRRARCRPFLRRGLSCGPNAADGNGYGDGLEHDPGRREARHGATASRPAPFADHFLTHMLTRNIRIEEDLIDQLFNSTEKRLARTLLLLARYGEPRRLTAHFRRCLRRSSPKWSERPARGSISS